MLHILDNSGPSKAEIAANVVKTFLCIAKETADAFPPLKSAVGGVCAIIETIDVSKTAVLIDKNVKVKYLQIKKGNEEEIIRLIERTDRLLCNTLNNCINDPKFLGSGLEHESKSLNEYVICP